MIDHLKPIVVTDSIRSLVIVLILRVAGHLAIMEEWLRLQGIEVEEALEVKGLPQRDQEVQLT
jgi:hypothetical protein